MIQLATHITMAISYDILYFYFITSISKISFPWNITPTLLHNHFSQWHVTVLSQAIPTGLVINSIYWKWNLLLIYLQNQGVKKKSWAWQTVLLSAIKSFCCFDVFGDTEQIGFHIKCSSWINDSRQEYWSGLPFPFPGDLPDPRVKIRNRTQVSCIVGRFFTIWAIWEAYK